MAEKTKTLITLGESPHLLTGRSLLHNLTQSNEVCEYNTAKERLRYTRKHKYYPIELFGACICVLQELYKYFPVDYIVDIAKATQKALYYFEKRKRENPDTAPQFISFLGADITLKFEIDLRELYKKQYNSKKPGSNDMRKYVALFRDIANTPILFSAETKQGGDTLTTSFNEPLFRFAPLPIETGEKQPNKKGDKPYKILLKVNAMAVYRVMDTFIKFPLDLPTRLTTASTDNPVYKSLIYLLLEKRSDIDKKVRAYLSAKAKNKKVIPPYPCKYDFHISQITEQLQLQGYKVRPYRLETYIINAFDAFRDKVGIIYKYEIIKNQKGEIINVSFDFNSQFYKELEVPSNEATTETGGTHPENITIATL